MALIDRDIRDALKEGKITPEEIEKFRLYVRSKNYFNEDYSWGYLCALHDLERWFADDTAFETLCQWYKLKRNAKTLHKLIKFFLRHLEPLRMGKLDRNCIGWDPVKKEFSYYVCKRCLVRADDE